VVFSLLAEGVESRFGGLDAVLACGDLEWREERSTMMKYYFTANAVVSEMIVGCFLQVTALSLLKIVGAESGGATLRLGNWLRRSYLIKSSEISLLLVLWKLTSFRRFFVFI
jgi:hypothetical protein